jgi:hypothetical protein
VPAYGREKDVTLGKILLMPFVKQKDDWVGELGSRLVRPHEPSRRLELAE